MLTPIPENKKLFTVISIRNSIFTLTSDHLNDLPINNCELIVSLWTGGLVLYVLHGFCMANVCFMKKPRSILTKYLKLLEKNVFNILYKLWKSFRMSGRNLYFLIFFFNTRLGLTTEEKSHYKQSIICYKVIENII